MSTPEFQQGPKVDGNTRSGSIAGWLLLIAVMAIVFGGGKAIADNDGGTRATGKNADRIESVIAQANAMRGMSYQRAEIPLLKKFGEVTPASLTQWSFKAGGVSLPDDARKQLTRGKEVTAKQAQRGDLVAWKVGNGVQLGVYLGGGKVIYAGPKEVVKGDVAKLGEPTFVRRLVV